MRASELTVVLISICVAALAGCSCGDCGATIVHEDGGCADRWDCTGSPFNSGIYEVSCHDDVRFADGGPACRCLRDGKPERLVGTGGWCTAGISGDVVERALDANSLCGWSMPTNGI